jgi:hypothetical protein
MQTVIVFGPPSLLIKIRLRDHFCVRLAYSFAVRLTASRQLQILFCKADTTAEILEDRDDKEEEKMARKGASVGA